MTQVVKILQMPNLNKFSWNKTFVFLLTFWLRWQSIPWSCDHQVPCCYMASQSLSELNIVNSLRSSDAYFRQWTNHHWFKQWLVTWPAPSHYLSQCWNIVNWTIGNKLQWNINRNWYIFIQENPFENFVWKTTAILSRLQCVKETTYPSV